MPTRGSTNIAEMAEARALPAGRNLLFLREEELRLAQDLLFFGYRDFTAGADEILATLDMGRAHHRVLHFVGRRPGITVGELLGILGITKQSLGRVLQPLMSDGYLEQIEVEGKQCIRLTPQGEEFLAKLWGVAEKCEDRILEGFTRQEREQLDDMLVRIQKNCENMIKTT